MNIVRILVIMALTFKQSRSCGLENQCLSTGECKDLHSFSQLNTTGCLSSDPYFRLWFDSKYLSLYVSQPLILDKTLPLGELINITIGDIKISHESMNGIVQFTGIKGFDLNLLTSYTLIPYVEFDFFKINFALYNNGQILDMSCQNEDWLKQSSNVLNLFGGKPVKLADLSSVSNICPTVFHLVEYNHLNIQGKMLQFDATNYSFLKEVRTNITTVILRYHYNLELSNKTIHPNVFGNITQLIIDISSIRTIQTNLFKPFDQLRLISLHIINLRYFFHMNKIDWLCYYNARPDNNKYFGLLTEEAAIHISQNHATLQIRNNLNDQSLYPVKFFPYLEYKYPNEDFCLFASFPHENIIIPSLDSANTTECTCTLQWILKYIPYYNALLDWDQYITYTNTYLCNVTCKINSYMNSCNTTTTSYNSSYEPRYFDLYNLRNLVLDMQSILLDIFGPITAALAILTNLGTMITIHYAPVKKKTFRNETVCDGLLYRYMFWNAVVNLVYSSIYFFFYLIKCNPKASNQYGLVDDTCFIEQIYINVIGSILKLMSNFSFVQMCMNRFVLIGDKHPERIVKIAHTKPRKFFIIISVMSALLSVVVYFNEQLFGSQAYINGKVVYELYYYHQYYWYWHKDHKNQTMQIVEDKLKQLPLISPFMLIHDFFSYFFFCIASTVIDALTVKNLRKVLAEKKKKSSVDHQDQSKKSELKSIIMIVLISFFNFTLRFPELFSTIVFYLLFGKESQYTFKNLCYSYRECLPIVELTNVFCILSLSLNFIFYVIFDNNFRIAFDHCLAKMKSAKQPAK